MHAVLQSRLASPLCILQVRRPGPALVLSIHNRHSVSTLRHCELAACRALLQGCMYARWSKRHLCRHCQSHTNTCLQACRAPRSCSRSSAITCVDSHLLQRCGRRCVYMQRFIGSPSSSHTIWLHRYRCHDHHQQHSRHHSPPAWRCRTARAACCRLLRQRQAGGRAGGADAAAARQADESRLGCVSRCTRARTLAQSRPEAARRR